MIPIIHFLPLSLSHQWTDMSKSKSKSKSKSSVMEHLTAIATSLVSSKLQDTPSSASLIAEKRRLFHHLRRFLLLAVRLLLRFIFLILSRALPPRTPRLSSSPSPAAPNATSAARALAHVLDIVSRVPVASRKYELVRSLADRLLDDNLQFSAGLQSLNQAALSHAFSRTLRRLELAVAGSTPGDRSLDLVMGAVRSGLRWCSSGEEEDRVPAEKLAAELLWLAEKMTACGAAEEAVERWGAAAGLACLALSAEAKLQVDFVRLSVFLFKHANAMQDDEQCCPIAHRRMAAMLTSWLPLLCRASNGADTPTLSSAERAETVRVLDETIHKLPWYQQEEVLALWLHHFTACPDSDWPNLESCYTRWYAQSRNLFHE